MRVQEGHQEKMERWLSISFLKHTSKQRIWTSYLHVQGTLYCHNCRRCSRLPKKFLGPLTPSNRTNRQPSLTSDPRTFQISMSVLPWPVQLWSYITQTSRLWHHCTQKDLDKALMGHLWCSRLECWCSAPTLPVLHHCSKSHPSDPSLRHSGI